MWPLVRHLGFVGFDNSAASMVPRSTILWNLNTICPCVAELEQCNGFSNCHTLRAQLGKRISRVGGPYLHGVCSRSEPNINAIHYCFRFWIFALFLGHRAWKVRGSKIGAKFRTFDPLWKIGEGWWRCIYELFVLHICSQHWYIFYPWWLVWSGHTLDSWLEKKKGKTHSLWQLCCRRLNDVIMNQPYLQQRHNNRCNLLVLCNG